MKYANAAAPSTPFAFILDTTSSVTPAVASLKYALSSSLAIVSSWPYPAAADAPNLSASLYLISGVLFILALRGLSSPETSRQGNVFGILGMVLAIVVTFLFVDILSSSFIFTICALVIGGSIGTIIAYRISMTAMPQLVASFHSLVGLAAVLVALSAFYNPQAFELGTPNNIKIANLIEMSIGASIGAITFTGSIIAFLKLQGLMSGSPITFRGQYFINLLIARAR